MQNRCQECHREGEVAPFAMGSYDEIVGWAETIREVVNGPHAAVVRQIPSTASSATTPGSPTKKKLIATWVDNGCPRGP